jgi:hypothetical protein
VVLLAAGGAEDGFPRSAAGDAWVCSAEELFDRVREALETAGLGVRFPETIWLGGP